jgi:hypothetical protein
MRKQMAKNVAVVTTSTRFKPADKLCAGRQ